MCNLLLFRSSEVDGEDTYLAHYRKQQVEEQRRWRGSASTQHAVVHHLPTSVPTLARDDEHGCRATLFQGAHFDGWEANFDGEGSFFASVWADHGARVGEVSSLRVEGGNRTSQCFVEVRRQFSFDVPMTLHFGVIIRQVNTIPCQLFVLPLSYLKVNDAMGCGWLRLDPDRTHCQTWLPLGSSMIELVRYESLGKTPLRCFPSI